MPQPLSLSVIIPTFRRDEQLLAAIGSALANPLSTEVLVIDDSPERSAEDSVRSIRDPRIRYEPMPEVSVGRPALVRNYGIGLARGRYLYFLDDDDAVFPGALETLVSALDSSGSAVAFGRVECVGPDRQIREDYDRWFTWAAKMAKRFGHSSWLTVGVIMFRGTLLINSCCVIRRDVALGLGGYDPDLSVYEDVEFFARGIRRSGHVFVDVPVLRYSTGQQSIIHDLGRDMGPVQRSYRQMHQKYRDRHGALEYRLLQVVSKLLPVKRPPHGVRRMRSPA